MLTFKKEGFSLLFALLQISGPAVGHLPSGPESTSDVVSEVCARCQPAGIIQADCTQHSQAIAFALPFGVIWFLSETKLVLLSEDRWTRVSASSAHPLIKLAVDVTFVNI